MKTRFIIFVFFLAFTGIVNAQAPHSLNYQSVVRNSIGEIEMNKLVSFRISILKGSATGIMVYSETHKKVTNEFGLVTLEVGNGTVVSGVFNNIDWGSDIYFLKTEFDINGGTSYTFMGTSQLLYVPYAIYAEKAGNAQDDYDKDNTNEIQTIDLVGNDLNLSNNGGSADLTGYLDNTDAQTLSLNGNQLAISGGNTVTFTGAVDLDADPTNELQNLELINDTLKISHSNQVVFPHDDDLDSSNEIQAISKVGNTVSLSKNGGFITVTDSQTLSVINNQLTISSGNTVNIDSDTTNELQYVSFINDTLHLTNGNYCVIPISQILPSGSCITTTSKNPPPGYSYSGNYFYSKENPWVAKANMLQTSQEAKAVTINGFIYVVNYPNDQITHPLIDVYNPSLNTWSHITDVPTLRRYFSIAAINDTIYFIGGAINGTITDLVESYDISLNSWTTKNPLPNPRTDLGCAVVNNRIYIFGGRDQSNNYLNSTCEYNPNTNEWVTKANMPTSRGGIDGAVLNNKIYVPGGFTSAGSSNLCNEIYDPILDSWSSCSEGYLNNTRFGYGIVANDQRIFILGGGSGNDEIFDTDLNYWSYSNFKTTQSELGAVILNGYIYAIGGGGGQGKTNKCQKIQSVYYIHCVN